jgi:glutaredoxin
MMSFIRAVLSGIILTLDAVFSPRAIQRSPGDQAKADGRMKGLVLYQFNGCPFCVKVRRELKRLNLRVELRDAQKVAAFKEELLKGGGELQVPCLRIPEGEGKFRWIYESSDIVEYLRKQVA